MMKAARLLLSFWLFCLIVTGFIHGKAMAQDSTIPLTIGPVYPKNQNPQTKGYFDLSVHANTKQTLSVKITNNQDRPVKISIAPANAFTNPTGGMMYKQNLDSSDAVLLPDAIKMANYLKVEKSVTVPPSSSVVVPIQLTVPDTGGQNLLGGILFTIPGTQTQTKQQAGKGKANFVIKTETVFAVAVQLNLPNKTASHFVVGNAGFAPNKGTAYIEMANDSQKIQDGVTGTYTVSTNNGKKLFSGQFGPFNMAPKSKIRYPIQWQNKTLNHGNYLIHLNGKVGDTTLKATKKFTIGSNEVKQYAQKYNPPQAATGNKGQPMWVWIGVALLFVIIVVLVGMIVFLMGRAKRKS
ncbi:DUF916 domain-containing protein [Pullulanibacillus sp. KACC 23026]|uniref:WxL protein peptidoglycan domain-containing protein n=1 Tax=Pullulanibacillus sp. KACC 23026 TaxID=3028315 RepID=UPI0023B1E5D4|nr:DUF916 domain-containing protein [Pullulanibacillus sp. KACC 23026]WEG13231.1 DUF916 domain-containing protein [Pullulanibacillus sp. KACC 23026]